MYIYDICTYGHVFIVKILRSNLHGGKFICGGKYIACLLSCLSPDSTESRGEGGGGAGTWRKRQLETEMEALLVRRTRLEECAKNYDQMQAISCPVPGGAGNSPFEHSWHGGIG